MRIEPTTSGLDLPLLSWLIEILQWVFHGFHIALKFTLQELILCSTICVHSAMRHNIHMYPYFLFAAIHLHNCPWLSLSDLVAQSAE